ncbi:hypothetical protein PFICI_12335 [Pestalotiopsis fici W106-1]|uniref:gamma-glutamylcyclotransferase n=1 Tax=Pestalotiopsis fici (strain W106-1 / CGMCC3.15140) TaxID=1229662 RepID=W3WRE4_PESFW|nr:uncharacterized protein PFICI_12335 [Pestalotiopsis fici W106-1]ETS75391.1 hypothetical protein PFICI_12335 [Pestalotiopsis fici W106-1]
MASAHRNNHSGPLRDNHGSSTATGAGESVDTKLYFAYGSNLSSTQMARRCPGATAVGLAHLSGWDWIINERHYANVVRRQQQQQATEKSKILKEEKDPGVYGVLYRLPPADEKELDLCEGVPWAYQKVMLEVLLVSTPRKDTVDQGEPETPDGDQSGNYGQITAANEAGEMVSALVYVDSNNVRPAAPMPEYVDRMSRGVREAHGAWGFPEWFADRVMKKYIPGLKWN